jgi:uncharacterized protein (TIGR03437 family)
MRYCRFHLYVILVCAFLLGAMPAAAQLPSNSSISGTYLFRYVGANTTGGTNAPVSGLGTMVFDGKGGYTVQAQAYTATTGSNQPSTVSTSGTYSVLSSGLFSMTNPFAPANSGIALFGGVGTVALVASSTDSTYCDQFVAIPASSGLSTATVSGTYNFVSMEFLNGSVNSSRDTFFPATADGKGGLGNVTVSGTAINLNHVATNQTSNGVTYSVTGNGTGTITFPTPAGVAATNVLISGAKTMYVSGDGNILLGGSSTGFDMFLAVKNFGSGNVNTAFKGFYFTALLNNDASTGGGGLYASDGTSNELGDANTTELIYERANYADSVETFGNYDYTSWDNFPFNSNGLVSFTGYGQYAMSPGGNLVIGSGLSTNYQLNVYVKSPALTGTGVFLNPQGAQNAASNAPFEAGLSQGEFVTFYGSNLASGTTIASALPFPTTLGNVQVTMKSLSAPASASPVALPIYYVSPTAISAIVPYDSNADAGDGNLVTIQVNNNGTMSNQIQLYSSLTSPGIFTVPSGGLGGGAILDLKYNLVSSSNPAKVGDTVQIYLTGLGTVSPAVQAGSAAPGATLSQVQDPNLAVYIDGVQAKVSFAGLAPGLAGLYQLNVVVPTGVTTGQADLIEVDTTDATSIQASIYISK